MTITKRPARRNAKAEDMGLELEVGELRGEQKALKERMDRADAALVVELSKINLHLQRQDDGALIVAKDIAAKFDVFATAQQEIKDILIAYGAEKKTLFKIAAFAAAAMAAATTFFSGAWSYVIGKH